jgi:hypothetical protein
MKPQWVRYKLGKAIEQSCSDILVHTLDVCKGTRLYNGYPTIEDDHDLWGMCTTSTECQTVLTIMLTVMSSTDPQMISKPWVGSWVGLVGY